MGNQSLHRYPQAVRIKIDLDTACTHQTKLYELRSKPLPDGAVTGGPSCSFHSRTSAFSPPASSIVHEITTVPASEDQLHISRRLCQARASGEPATAQSRARFPCRCPICGIAREEKVGEARNRSLPPCAPTTSLVQENLMRIGKRAQSAREGFDRGSVGDGRSVCVAIA